MKNTIKTICFVAFSSALALTGCRKEELIKGGSDLADWTAETHGYGATPNYNIVFNQDEVMRLDFVVERQYWDAMQTDLASLMSSTGGPGGPGGPGGGGGMTFSEESPIYVPAQMYFNGKQWYDVGLRYKGNSSLSSSYSQGNKKLPFRIEMNHFENENPNINGQTFYGFTQLSLSSNFKDDSQLHEKIAADVFREFGVPAPRTAFYRIYIDYGDGPIYFGLYTMLEVAFDTPMLNAQFGSSYGNCYKPDGTGCQFNDINAITSTYFPNKTNEGADLSDISSFVSALLSTNRTVNPSLWRTNLESTIDMNQYLKWLAANTTMKNWDTYGKMTHNFYLYNNPSSNKLIWIPWDNNEAFSNGPGAVSTILDFDFANLATTPLGPNGDVAWPMISYIYDDATYKTRYDNYIDDFITSAYTSANLNAKFTKYHNLIQPYVTGTYGEQTGYTTISSATAFDNSLSSLINEVATRIIEADTYTP
jgi:spore coat protein H